MSRISVDGTRKLQSAQCLLQNLYNKLDMQTSGEYVDMISIVIIVQIKYIIVAHFT